MRVLMLLAVLGLSVFTLGCDGAPCSAATCATGCCDASGACQTGTQPLSCGIAGGACNVCTLGQSCLQGTCFAGTGGGGGTGGGSGGGVGIRLMPASATVPSNAQVDLSAELTGAAPDQLIDWSIESGGGSLSPTGPSTATYYAYSSAATVRIRARANFMSSLATFADFSVSPSAQPFVVVPQPNSVAAYVLGDGLPQTFAALRFVFMSPSASYMGVRGLDWTVWPSGSITDGTVTATRSMKRIYAREQSSNIWASADIEVQTTPEPSISITPSLATVAPNGVVQFTANISSGASPQWVVSSANGGTITATGTYTAPALPGVYVIAVQPLGGNSSRYAAATIIVQ